MPNSRRQLLNVRRGFSLIEVLISVSIIVIISTAVLVSMRNNKTSKELEVAAREVAATIREAQNNALTGKKINDSDLPCKFGIHKTGNSEYKLAYYHHDFGDDCSSPTFQDIDTRTLKNGVIFKGGFSLIYYSVPQGEFAAPNVRLVTLTKNEKYISICAYPSGKIEESTVRNTNEYTCP
jgi:prepilin-type N-terminal cleavage/methylation domain-containing protein